jgi:hypothetical protein
MSDFSRSLDRPEARSQSLAVTFSFYSRGMQLDRCRREVVASTGRPGRTHQLSGDAEDQARRARGEVREGKQDEQAVV